MHFLLHEMPGWMDTRVEIAVSKWAWDKMTRLTLVANSISNAISIHVYCCEFTEDIPHLDTPYLGGQLPGRMVRVGKDGFVKYDHNWDYVLLNKYQGDRESHIAMLISEDTTYDPTEWGVGYPLWHTFTPITRDLRNCLDAHDLPQDKVVEFIDGVWGL